MKAVNLHDGIESTLLILRHRLRGDKDSPEITLAKSYGPLPLVECYPAQLNQVFMNILSNAIDALEETYAKAAANGHVSYIPTIRIQTKAVDEQRVLIQISDNGPGIPEGLQARLFDPFFTTKPIGQGTGLGLAICYQIVNERHQGQLQCISLPGAGTTFAIELPIRQTSKNQPNRTAGL
jgi:signal transduction histidine kinase